MGSARLQQLGVQLRISMQKWEGYAAASNPGRQAQPHTNKKNL
jgi:hypothetical protein